jgi:hypothetical protein
VITDEVVSWSSTTGHFAHASRIDCVGEVREMAWCTYANSWGLAPISGALCLHVIGTTWSAATMDAHHDTQCMGRASAGRAFDHPRAFRVTDRSSLADITGVGRLVVISEPKVDVPLPDMAVLCERHGVTVRLSEYPELQLDCPTTTGTRNSRIVLWYSPVEYR